jgi:hypothetical protein
MTTKPQSGETTQGKCSSCIILLISCCYWVYSNDIFPGIAFFFHFLRETKGRSLFSSLFKDVYKRESVPIPEISKVDQQKESE